MQNHAKRNQLTIFRTQKQNILFASIAFVFLAIISGIVWLFLQPSSGGIPKVLSLKERWDLIEKEAHSWQDDAYLTELIFFRTNNLSAFQIRAEFYSSRLSPQETLWVEIDKSGRLKTSPINNPQVQTGTGVSFGAKKPINKTEWSIDSQDALNIFAKDEQIYSCLQSSQEIELSLSKIQTEIPAWHLIIIDCPSHKGFNDFFIDANTGERLNPSLTPLP